MQFKTTFLKYTFLVLISFFVSGCTSNASDLGDEIEDLIDENLSEAEALLVLVNESRKAEGLSTLVLNEALNKAALSHSIDMETNDYFDHLGLDGSRFWERAADEGYTGSATGENIARGQSSVESVHNSWMNSDGHKANILNESSTEMGLGKSGAYWTQIFGKTP